MSLKSNIERLLCSLTRDMQGPSLSIHSPIRSTQYPPQPIPVSQHLDPSILESNPPELQLATKLPAGSSTAAICAAAAALTARAARASLSARAAHSARAARAARSGRAALTARAARAALAAAPPAEQLSRPAAAPSKPAGRRISRGRAPVHIITDANDAGSARVDTAGR